MWTASFWPSKICISLITILTWQYLLDGDKEVVANLLFFISLILRDILCDSSYSRNEICWVQTGPIFIPPLLHLASLETEEAQEIWNIFLDCLLWLYFELLKHLHYLFIYLYKHLYMYLQLTNWGGDHGICRKIETSRIINWTAKNILIIWKWFCIRLI